MSKYSSHLDLTRRGFVGGLAAAGALALGNGLYIGTADAKAPLTNTQIPYWYRFKLGSHECTVVSDGPLPLGDPAPGFPNAPKDELYALLKENFLPEKNLVLEQNAFVVNTGSRLILFDNGMGTSTMFGPTPGKLMANLKAAGIKPEDIDAVVFTHAHCDHCWGTMGDDGKPYFPNAEYFISKADFDFWTDESKASAAGAPPYMKPFVEGARKNLLPVRDRIKFVESGKEILPGIQAMATPGHTIGHMIYLITSGDQTLANSGDLTHHQVILLKKPAYEFAYDTDPKQAVQSRLKTFDMLAKERIPLLAYHFPFPGMGHVAKAGEGYQFYPTPMQMTL